MSIKEACTFYPRSPAPLRKEVVITATNDSDSEGGRPPPPPARGSVWLLSVVYVVYARMRLRAFL